MPKLDPITAIVAKAMSKSSSGKTPTAEQVAIINAVQSGVKVLLIEAGAGTGKTSVLRMLADEVLGNGQYTAFNAPLVAESKEKFQGTAVACNTTHSLAFRAVGKKYSKRLGGNRMRSTQVAKILGIQNLELPQEEKDEEGKPRVKTLVASFLAGQVMQAIKRFCQSADQTIQANHFRYIDGIDMPKDDHRTYANNDKVKAYLLPFAQKAWDDLSDTEGELPFSHDCYVKLWQLDNPVIAADFILLDEAQDTAPVMLDVLRQQKCQVILVGDSAQQIYEWRGAVNALGSFADAPRLLLSQSFRFGTAIAETANAVLDTLSEPTPLRLKGLKSIPSKIAPVEKPVAILTRTNALAVSTLLQEAAKGSRPFLVGGGADVVSFVEAALDLQQGKRTGHPELACFESWSEVTEYVKMDEGEDLKLMVKLIETFSCEKIITALRAMPQEGDADLIICTAHKSKGREWDTVQLGSDFPTKSKSQDSDKRLLYVAVTRAKLTLDVSFCPFFTGDDSLSILSVIEASKEVVDEADEFTPVPAAPLPLAPVEPGEFTWANWDDRWVVRGPAGWAGKSVTVVRKNGSKSRRLLGRVIREMNGSVCFYE